MCLASGLPHWRLTHQDYQVEVKLDEAAEATEMLYQQRAWRVQWFEVIEAKTVGCSSVISCPAPLWLLRRLSLRAAEALLNVDAIAADNLITCSRVMGMRRDWRQ
jgi:hypothetical protein